MEKSLLKTSYNPLAIYTHLPGLLLTETEDVGLDTEDIADDMPGIDRVFVWTICASFFSARSIASISALSAKSFISSITPSHSKALPSK